MMVKCVSYLWTGPETAYECPFDALEGTQFCESHTVDTVALVNGLLNPR